MYRFPFLMCVLVCALAVPAVSVAMNEWTIIVYQCADDSSSSTLEDAAIADLCELDSIGSQGGLEIIVQIDRGTKLSNLMQQVYTDPNYSGANRFLINKGKWVTEAKLGEVNMGSPKALYDCMKWAAKDHPAKHYFVVLAGHGSGVFSWRGTGSVSSANPGEVSPFDDYEDFVAYDSTDNDCLTVFEVSQVLENSAISITTVILLILSGLIHVMQEWLRCSISFDSAPKLVLPLPQQFQCVVLTMIP